MPTMRAATSSSVIVPIFAMITKIDEENRTVFGYASTQDRDQQGEIILRSAIEDALPDYMRWGNVREMHQPSAVGNAIEAVPDGKGLWFGAKVVDDRAWAKCKAKVYKGFSIGGRVTARDDDDKSIITALELTEISLVDRPANPEAVFEIVKRAKGTMQMQPVQKWDCGCTDHQHYTKDDAATCIAHELARLLDASETPVVEKKEQPQDDNGKFVTHTKASDSAQEKATKHGNAATAAKTEEGKHRRQASAAYERGDTEALRIHEHLAGAQAALAEQHEHAANNYRQLAARHSAAAAKSATQEHPDMAKTTAVTEAEKAATAAMALLNSAVNVNKAMIDHAAEANTARDTAMDHEKQVAEHEEAAAGAREEAMAALAAGKKDEADGHEAEAKQHEVTAAHHQNLADGFHELHAHHMEQQKGGDVDHAMHAQMAKDAGGEHAAASEKLGMAAKSHDMAAMQATAAGNEESAAHHTAMSKAATDSAGRRDKMAKDMGALNAYHNEAMMSPNAVKVVAKAALQLDKDGFDKTLGEWFGKREFSDKEREDAAASGEAMPDGSYPIKNGEDLANAVQAYGRAKDKAKAKAHITSRAKALGMTDKLPADWDGSTKEKAVAPGDIGAKAATMPCPNCKAEMPITNEKCMSCDAPMHKAVAVDKKAARIAAYGSVAKGMWVVQELTHLLGCIRNLQQSSAMEQIVEGDTDDPTPAKLSELLSEVAELLVAVVTRETAELMQDEDAEVVAENVTPMVVEAAAKSVNWAASIAEVLKGQLIAKGIEPAAKMKLSALRATLEKIGVKHSKADKAHAQIVHDHAVELGAECAEPEAGKAATITAEKDQAVKALEKMTTAVTGVARDVQNLNKKVVEQAATIAKQADQIKTLEKQPVGGGPRGIQANGKTITKGMDGGGEFDGGDNGATARETAQQIVHDAYMPTQK